MIQKVFLTFPQRLIDEPIVYELGRRFHVRTNIRGASITPEVALVALTMDGEPADVAAAIAHLEALGVHVERLAD